MRQGSFFILFIILAVALMVMGVDFENFSYEENRTEILLLFIVLVIGLIYLIRRNKR